VVNSFCWVAGAGTKTKTAGRERSGLSTGVSGEASSPQRKSQVKRVSVMYTKMQPKYKRYFTTNESALTVARMSGLTTNAWWRWFRSEGNLRGGRLGDVTARVGVRSWRFRSGQDRLAGRFRGAQEECDDSPESTRVKGE
jgi:hypothetical protein